MLSQLNVNSCIDNVNITNAISCREYNTLQWFCVVLKQFYGLSSVYVTKGNYNSNGNMSKILNSGFL